MVYLETGRIYTNLSSNEENNNDKRNVIKEMMKIVSLLSLVTIVLMSCIQGALFTPEDERKFEAKNGKVTTGVTFSHHAVLDELGNYHLYWLPEEKMITFEVQVSLPNKYL